MPAQVVYKLEPVLDDPRYEGFGFGDQAGVRGGSVYDDFKPDSPGPDWKPPTLGRIWRPLRVRGRVRAFNDYPCLGMTVPAFSQHAVEALRDVLVANGELLPLDSHLGTYYAFNIRTVADALDVRRSIMARFDDGRVFDIQRHEFVVERLRGLTIFKLRECWGEAYVTHPFVERVVEHGLKGFEFLRVWPLAPDEDYHKLHKREKALRESAELPPGRSLKGNGVVIELSLDGERATEQERQWTSRLADELDEVLVDIHSEAPAVGNLEQIEYVRGQCWLSLSTPPQKLGADNR